MKTNMNLTLGFLILSLVAIVSSGKISNPETQFSDLKNYIYDFSVDFYKKISKERVGKSLVTSPVSAKIVLAMLSMGAKGDTLKELTSGLHLPDSSFPKSAYKTVVDKIHNSKGCVMKTANGIFVTADEGYEIDPDFGKKAVDIFSTDVECIDFHHVSTAVKAINTWAEENTDKKVDHFVDESMIPHTTQLMLANAAYFQGTWLHPFNKHLTKDCDFYVDAHKSVNVHMMETVGNYNFAEISYWNSKIIELPYKEEDLSLVILLPNQADGLAWVESKIKTGHDLVTVFKKMEKQLVSVRIPRFTIESEFEMIEPLKKLNIKQIFADNCELGGITKNEKDLKVSQAIQKVIVDVEEGIFDDSVAEYVVGSHGSKHPIKFEADHPFLFCIKTRDNIPVFVGKFAGPKH